MLCAGTKMEGAAAKVTAAYMVRAKCGPFHGNPKVFGA